MTTRETHEAGPEADRPGFLVGAIATHPVAGFLALTFLISFGAGLPLLWAVPALLPFLPTLTKTYLARLVVVFGPAAAALLVTAVTSGRPGLLRLRRRFSYPVRSLASLLAMPPLALGLAAIAYRGAGIPFRDLGETLAARWPLLASHYLLQILLVAVGEETGWRGWLLPRLLHTRRPLVAALLVGAVWSVWHGPVLASGLTAAFGLVALALALSILFTLLWFRYGSLIPIIVAHGSVNAPIFFFSDTIHLSRAAEPWLLYAASYVSLAMAGLIARWRWWARAPHTEVQVPL